MAAAAAELRSELEARERTRPHGRAEKARNLRAARASRERQRGAPEWFGRRGVGAFSRLEETEQTAGRPLREKNAGVSQTAALKKNTTLYLYATLYCA